jgi:hypothetical protein
VTATAPLAPDLVAGLKRLKLARIRAMAPETLQQAKTQRWTPEELLRTFVEAEITARDAANLRQRQTAAGFPVRKTLDQFKVQASSVPQATFDYLASLEWLRAAENCCLIGPAGTGKSHLLVALGHAAITAGYKVRYLTAAELVETLYQDWPTTQSAGCWTGCCATTWCWSTRSALRPWTQPAPSCCSGSWPPPTNAAASPPPATGPSTSGAGSYPNTPPPSPCWTGCSTTPPSWSPRASRSG